MTHLEDDFGWVRIDAEPRRVYASSKGRKAWFSPPSHPGKMECLVWMDDADSWVSQRIAAGDVERIGPIPATSTYERRSHREFHRGKRSDQRVLALVGTVPDRVTAYAHRATSVIVRGTHAE